MKRYLALSLSLMLFSLHADEDTPKKSIIQEFKESKKELEEAQRNKFIRKQLEEEKRQHQEDQAEYKNLVERYTNGDPMVKVAFNEYFEARAHEIKQKNEDAITPEEKVILTSMTQLYKCHTQNINGNKAECRKVFVEQIKDLDYRPNQAQEITNIIRNKEDKALLYRLLMKHKNKNW